MPTLKHVRAEISQRLWNYYKTTAPHAQVIETNLLAQGEQITLDHCAIIDLPSAHSGRQVLAQLFGILGYELRGHDYLPEKHNDFLWMAEEDAMIKSAESVLPQIVLADFRLEELPPEIQNIVKKYTQHISANILEQAKALRAQLLTNNPPAAEALINLVYQYLTERPWPLPSVADYEAVCQVNELMAWVMVFGRCPNHFTIGAHLLKNYQSLTDFNHFVSQHLGFELNQIGDVIKGSSEMGLEQSSTLGERTQITLVDGNIELPGCFMEFVWRHPKTDKAATEWQDYFTGFIAGNANRVVESLYEAKQ